MCTHLEVFSCTLAICWNHDRDNPPSTWFASVLGSVTKDLLHPLPVSITYFASKLTTKERTAEQIIERIYIYVYIQNSM